MMVSHGNEVNVILPNSIDDIVGKTRNDPLPESASERGTCFRVDGNPFGCLLYSRQESKAEPVKSSLIKLD